MASLDVLSARMTDYEHLADSLLAPRASAPAVTSSPNCSPASRRIASTRRGAVCTSSCPRWRRRATSPGRCASDSPPSCRSRHADPRVGERRRDDRQVPLRHRRRFEIETVLMLYPDRATVCVSSQAGCAMACGFCATGQAGFDRHLTAARSSSRSCWRRPREAGRTATEQCRVHGHGRTARQRGSVWPAVERITPASACRPVTSRSRPSVSRPASASSPPTRCR